MYYANTFPLLGPDNRKDNWATGERQYLDDAIHIAGVLEKFVAADGSFPYRIRLDTGEVVEPDICGHVQGLNRRWSAGLWLQGRGYTPMGVDAFGNGYVPVNVTWADETHIMAGHPIIADKNGKDLFIQVTHLNDNPQLWHVSVNNPTDRKVRTKLRQVMEVPGLAFKTRTVTLKPGKYQVLP